MRRESGSTSKAEPQIILIVTKGSGLLKLMNSQEAKARRRSAAEPQIKRTADGPRPQRVGSPRRSKLPRRLVGSGRRCERPAPIAAGARPFHPPQPVLRSSNCYGGWIALLRRTGRPLHRLRCPAAQVFCRALGTVPRGSGVNAALLSLAHPPCGRTPPFPPRPALLVTLHSGGRKSLLRNPDRATARKRGTEQRLWKSCAARLRRGHVRSPRLITWESAG